MRPSTGQCSYDPLRMAQCVVCGVPRVAPIDEYMLGVWVCVAMLFRSVWLHIHMKPGRPKPLFAYTAAGPVHTGPAAVYPYVQAPGPG